ncbi:MAG TPA: peptide ABC transporter permease, partial [Gammaproteobacteria bacterium]|nr:peptide ABC transporter permease [Gammaproteobacteria bacterium]
MQQALSNPHTRAKWRLVFARPIAMASATLLLLFVSVALLDSIHFRLAMPFQDKGEVEFQNEVKSVLAVVFVRILPAAETTYSAPLAQYSFSKETIRLEDGSTIRSYPRLQHGGAHLIGSRKPRAQDIAERLLLSVFEAVICSGILLLLLAALIKSERQESISIRAKEILVGTTTVPWRASLIVVFFIMVLVFVIINLGSVYHLFGTDKVGADVLYQAIKSIRTGITIGTVTTLIMLPVALALGMSAGYFGGRTDDIIQYFYTTLSSIPGVLLIASASLMLDLYMEQYEELFRSIAQRQDVRLLALCFILGITSWTGLCRLLRAEVLKLKEMDYVQAAHAFGVSQVLILLRHLLPNIMHIVLITIVLDFSGLVLAEAVLSYIGIGVDPTMESWGNMINRARLEMARDPMVWWSLATAFFFMLTLVLSANLFADAVRDAFD